MSKIDSKKVILARNTLSVPPFSKKGGVSLPKTPSSVPTDIGTPSPKGGKEEMNGLLGENKVVILAKPSLPLAPAQGTLSRQGESKKVILAIETSCDETAAAVLEVNLSLNPSPQKERENSNWPEITTLSSIVNSQIKLHSKMGGVVPEVAARAHVKDIRPVVTAALQASSYKLSAISYIAVTAGPGLIPSLIVGVEFAKALSLATGKPLIPVNHMLGHLYSPFGRIKSKAQISNDKKNPKSEIINHKSFFPNISLIVSGGHTILVLMPARGGSASGGENSKEYIVLGQTVDDAAGEAFDKVAKLLGLPYPGGPEVSRLALKGNPTAINFPRPMLHAKNYDFSFSGLKTAVLYYVRSLATSDLSLATKQDICASFQAAAVDVLVQKTMRAVKQFNAKSVSLSGGVAANQLLRSELIVNCQKLNVEFMAPPMNLCTDNAEMIGIAAAFMLKNGFKPVNFKKVKADSNLHL